MKSELKKIYVHLMDDRVCQLESYYPRLEPVMASLRNKDEQFVMIEECIFRKEDVRMIIVKDAEEETKKAEEVVDAEHNPV